MKKAFLIVAVLFSQCAFAQNNSTPHLLKNDGKVRLIVNNEPLLLLSGELHNSSTGSAHRMRIFG